MQLIQRKTLLYQAGSSDKVYEVDLCEVAVDRYLVNYRYGRRGGALKEGSQTPAALDLGAAQQVFDKLAASKVAKGYREAGTAAPVIAKKAVNPSLIPDVAGRDRYIIDRLAAAVNNPSQADLPKQWPIDQVIWRAGELQLAVATPLLMQLWGKNPLRNYSIAWALGNCGDQSAIPLLERAYRNSSNLEHVRRISLEAIFKLSDAKKAELRPELINSLPLEIRQSIDRQESVAVMTELTQKWLSTATPQQFSILEVLYQIDLDLCRSTVLDILQTAPLAPNYFKAIRHIFKIAEYRQDATVLGLLTYRFDQEPAFFNSCIDFQEDRAGRNRQLQIKTWQRDAQTGKYRSIHTAEFKKEISSSDARMSYGSSTRAYLRRRVWRSLKTLGELSRSAYVDVAVEILLHYYDEDAGVAKESVRYRYDRRTWQRYESSRTNWDVYARYLTFNHILYTNSPRYELKAGTTVWRCKADFKPSDPTPPSREEAFPHLWAQQPSALIRLLCESKCQRVHEFAVKAIASCPQFCQELLIDILIQLLAKPYEVTAQLGFELAQSRYQPAHPQTDLILAIANCAYLPARKAAHQWLRNQIDRFLRDEVLIAGLVLSPQADTQLFIRQVLETAIMATDHAQILIARIIAGILALTAEQTEIAENATQILTNCFQVQLRPIGLEVILDLLRHPLGSLQTLGARILLDRQTPVIELPAGLIDALIESPVDAVRSIGVQLFGQLPDELLVERLELILSFVTHEILTMRQAIVPCLRRLAIHPEFLAQLIDRLLPILLAPEAHAGLHDFISQLLQTDLPNWMEVANQSTAWMLLSANATSAQELAGKLLQTNSDRWAVTMSTERIAELTHHEILAVRQSGWKMLSTVLPRLRQSTDDLLAATLVMASKWDDSRQYGFNLFGEILQPSELSPSVVIGICDSNREDVRRFGRDLVGKCFQAKDGLEYLLKFSEHPTADMQLFASQYLEDYAAGNPDRLAELAPYFGQVLAHVNRSRVAKVRIFNFLSEEAMKSLTAARVVAEVLTRQSGSIAINERARCLETLLKIHQRYPELVVPIRVKEVVLR
jgi:HEAT repeat protein/predicted DNA-binding WGR domain protein